LSKITEKFTIKELEVKVMSLRKGEGFLGFGVFCLEKFDIDSECKAREVVIASW